MAATLVTGVPVALLFAWRRRYLVGWRPGGPVKDR